MAIRMDPGIGEDDLQPGEALVTITVKNRLYLYTETTTFHVKGSHAEGLGALEDGELLHRVSVLTKGSDQ